MLIIYSFPVLDIVQVGRRARDYCEVASRTAPTYTDVELALVDVGKSVFPKEKLSLFIIIVILSYYVSVTR